MKKKFWLTLYNIGVSILFLLSLYSYAKGMAGFSLFLALAVFGEIAAKITLMIYSIFNERGGIRPSTSVASSFSIYFNQNLFHHIA